MVFWTDPIVAEFLFGMAIAALATTGIGLSLGASVGLALLALLWLIGGYASGIGGSRPVTTGLPVAMLVAAAVFGRNVRLPTALVLLGDSSYALYLVHPFAMRAVQLFWHWLRLTGPVAAIAYAAISLLLAVAASVAVYEWFERPINASLRARLAERRARQAPLPRGAI